MPENHQKYLQWDGERFGRWAESIGPATAMTVKGILSSHKIQQQGYKSCMGLLKLADKYSARRLEDACTQALSYTASPSYKSVKNILSAKQEAHVSPEESNHKAKGITRGADFYRRKSND